MTIKIWKSRKYGLHTPIRLDAESVEQEYNQNVKLDNTMLQTIKLEFRLLYFEQMVDWILTNNSGFVQDLTCETMDRFEQKATETLKAKYPEYFD